MSRSQAFACAAATRRRPWLLLLVLLVLGVAAASAASLSRSGALLETETQATMAVRLRGVCEDAANAAPGECCFGHRCKYSGAVCCVDQLTCCPSQTVCMVGPAGHPTRCIKNVTILAQATSGAANTQPLAAAAAGTPAAALAAALGASPAEILSGSVPVPETQQILTGPLLNPDRVDVVMPKIRPPPSDFVINATQEEDAIEDQADEEERRSRWQWRSQQRIAKQAEESTKATIATAVQVLAKRKEEHEKEVLQASKSTAYLPPPDFQVLGMEQNANGELQNVLDDIQIARINEAEATAKLAQEQANEMTQKQLQLSRDNANVNHHFKQQADKNEFYPQIETLAAKVKQARADLTMIRQWRENEIHNFHQRSLKDVHADIAEIRKELERFRTRSKTKSLHEIAEGVNNIITGGIKENTRRMSMEQMLQKKFEYDERALQMRTAADKLKLDAQYEREKQKAAAEVKAAAAKLKKN